MQEQARAEWACEGEGAHEAHDAAQALRVGEDTLRERLSVVLRGEATTHPPLVGQECGARYIALREGAGECFPRPDAALQCGVNTGAGHWANERRRLPRERHTVGHERTAPGAKRERP